MKSFSPLDSVYSNRAFKPPFGPFSKINRDCVDMAKALPVRGEWNCHGTGEVSFAAFSETQEAAYV